jgi:hypothetical protein
LSACFCVFPKAVCSGMLMVNLPQEPQQSEGLLLQNAPFSLLAETPVLKPSAYGLPEGIQAFMLGRQSQLASVPAEAPTAMWAWQVAAYLEQDVLLWVFPHAFGLHQAWQKRLAWAGSPVKAAYMDGQQPPLTERTLWQAFFQRGALQVLLITADCLSRFSVFEHLTRRAGVRLWVEQAQWLLPWSEGYPFYQKWLALFQQTNWRPLLVATTPMLSKHTLLQVQQQLGYPPNGLQAIALWRLAPNWQRVELSLLRLQQAHFKEDRLLPAWFKGWLKTPLLGHENTPYHADEAYSSRARKWVLVTANAKAALHLHRHLQAQGLNAWQGLVTLEQHRPSEQPTDEMQHEEPTWWLTLSQFETQPRAVLVTTMAMLPYLTLNDKAGVRLVLWHGASSLETVLSMTCRSLQKQENEGRKPPLSVKLLYHRKEWMKQKQVLGKQATHAWREAHHNADALHDWVREDVCRLLGLYACYEGSMPTWQRDETCGVCDVCLTPEGGWPWLRRLVSLWHKLRF